MLAATAVAAGSVLFLEIAALSRQSGTINYLSLCLLHTHLIPLSRMRQAKLSRTLPSSSPVSPLSVQCGCPPVFVYTGKSCQNYTVDDVQQHFRRTILCAQQLTTSSTLRVLFRQRHGPSVWQLLAAAMTAKIIIYERAKGHACRKCHTLTTILELEPGDTGRKWHACPVAIEPL